MTDNPVAWLKGHINEGVHLREAAWDLTEEAAGDAWARCAKQWERELKAKVGGWSKADLDDLEVLDEIPFLDLRLAHVWYTARPAPSITKGESTRSSQADQC